MQRIGFSMRIYKTLLKATLRGMMQYRADFWMSLIGVVILNGANILQMGVISWRFSALGGWSAGDLMLLYGLFMVSWSIHSIFFRNVATIEADVLSGTFDKYLLRPVSPFLQLVGGDFRYVGICDTLLGAVLVWYGYSMSPVVWGALDCLWLAVCILSGGITVTCIRLLISCASFWTTKASALNSIFTQIYLMIQKYPVSIFGTAFRVLVTAIVPVAFLNFYPATLLLRKADAPLWLCALSPAVALLLVWVSSIVWKAGLRRYNGSGG